MVRVVWFAARLGELLRFFLSPGDHCLHPVHFAVVGLGRYVLSYCRQDQEHETKQASRPSKEASEVLLQHVVSPLDFVRSKVNNHLCETGGLSTTPSNARWSKTVDRTV